MTAIPTSTTNATVTATSTRTAPPTSSLYFTHTVFTFTNARIPSAPSSRP